MAGSNSVRLLGTTMQCLLGLSLAVPAATIAAVPGDRIECDTTGTKSVGYRAGVVIPFLPGDTFNGYGAESGYFVRVRLDGWSAEGIFCKTEDLRAGSSAPAPASAPVPAPTAIAPAQSATTPTASTRAAAATDGTVPADRPLLSCPIEQASARNGDAPDTQLLERVFRCEYGEKPAAPGLDGAVTIDVASMQIGRQRAWIYAGGSGGGDLGGGNADTVVWPVKTKYTEKVHYRYSTTVSADAIKVVNFFVNDFGEWRSGSAESIKMPETQMIQK